MGYVYSRLQSIKLCLSTPSSVDYFSTEKLSGQILFHFSFGKCTYVHYKDISGCFWTSKRTHFFIKVHSNWIHTQLKIIIFFRKGLKPTVNWFGTILCRVLPEISCRSEMHRLPQPAAEKTVPQEGLPIWRVEFYVPTLSLIKIGLMSKLYTPSTLNIVLIQWHTHLNVCAVK